MIAVLQPICKVWPAYPKVQRLERPNANAHGPLVLALRLGL